MFYETIKLIFSLSFIYPWGLTFFTLENKNLPNSCNKGYPTEQRIATVYQGNLMSDNQGESSNV